MNVVILERKKLYIIFKIVNTSPGMRESLLSTEESLRTLHGAHIRRHT